MGGGASLESEQAYSTSPHTKSLPQPIGRPERTGSVSSDSFQRAVGAEVKSKSLEDEGQVYIRKQMQLIDADSSLDETEKQRRKQVPTSPSPPLSQYVTGDTHAFCVND